jgi:6-pyruvoyltetrahydropterin/6-carboxytetrahydropterin synthase
MRWWDATGDFKYMYTCSKIYYDIPFAHRQHLHKGHCSLIHGHNWTIRLTFGCHELDEHGFVIDFGGLRFIKNWIDENLDHACVFAAEDMVGRELIKQRPEVFKVYIVDNCSAEGLASHLFDVFEKMVDKESGGRVFLHEIELREDSKNAVQFQRGKQS